MPFCRKQLSKTIRLSLGGCGEQLPVNMDWDNFDRERSRPGRGGNYRIDVAERINSALQTVIADRTSWPDHQFNCSPANGPW